MADAAKRIIASELKGLSKEKWVNIELENGANLFCWDVALLVLNPDSLYYGGYYKARMTFPQNYPYLPPDFKFTTPLYHPNIYPDGKLCISILHPPGEDATSGELASERWNPAQRAESVLISIISLLDDPEVSSPANVDAGVMLRKQPEMYKKRVKQDVELSKKSIPEGFVMPTHETTKPPPAKDFDDDFWAPSDEEDGFGGSDSEMEDDEEEDEDVDEDTD